MRFGKSQICRDTCVPYCTMSSYFNTRHHLKTFAGSIFLAMHSQFPPLDRASPHLL